MTLAAALLAVALVAWADAESPPSDLDLYGATFLAGMHSHPVGIEGRRLKRAESALSRRRLAVRSWLVARIGQELVAQREEAIFAEDDTVYYTRGPTVEEEWAAIARARQALAKSEKRSWQARRRGS